MCSMNKFAVLSVAMPVDLWFANLLACSLWSVRCRRSTGKGPLKQAIRMQIPTASQWTWHDINRIFITLLYMFTKTIHQLNGLVQPQPYCVKSSNCVYVRCAPCNVCMISLLCLSYNFFYHTVHLYVYSCIRYLFNGLVDKSLSC